MNALESALPEIAGLPLFKGIEKSRLLELCANAQIVVNNHRDELFPLGGEAHSFGIVLSGAYKMSKISPAGEDVIVHFATSGEVIAAFIMANPKGIYPVSVRSMGPSRFLRVPKEIYLKSWAGSPELLFRIQNLLSSRMGALQDQKTLLKAPLSAKVALLLLNLLAKDASSDQMISIPLTRKEIADNLGASVESVIRIMSEWSKLNIIKTNDQHIQILMPDKLAQFINKN